MASDGTQGGNAARGHDVEFQGKQEPCPGQAASAAPGLTSAEQRSGEALGQGGPGLAAERNADAPAPNAATAPEKLVRDVYDYLPHRVAEAGEKYGLLAAKFDEEVAEVKAAAIGSPEFIEELGDLIDVCHALGGPEVERVRLAKRAERGGFDKLLVMKLSDRTDK